MYTPHVPEPSYVQAIYKMRQEEILKEVEHRRMLRLIRSKEQSFVERIMLAVGKSMIVTGERIRERYAPVAAQGCEHYSARYKFNKLGYETSSEANLLVKKPHTAIAFTEGRCSTRCDDVVQDLFSMPVNPSIRS
jgi:hypothetical protein